MAKQTSADKKESKYGVAGLFIPAGVLGGMGFGFVYNNVPAGLFIGLGAGFVLMAITVLFLQRRK